MNQAALSALLLSISLANGMLLKHEHAHFHQLHPHTKPPYVLAEDYASSPEHFFSESSWDFQTFPDPTHGSVEYVNYSTATDMGLLRFVAPADGSKNSYSKGSPVYIAVGNPQSAQSGRSAVRLQSKRAYNAGTLVVADIAHIPGGCGTWPALWMLNADLPWPQGGEWDIVENVNGAEQVAVTLHTTAGCTMDKSSKDFGGTLQTTDCNVKAANQSPNAGCSILAPGGSKSFGSAFNTNGGGIFVAEWRHDGFSVWFFPRHNDVGRATSGANMTDSQEGGYPPTLLSENPNTSRLGIPIAKFDGAGCDWASHFKNMRLVINTSLCGDWAGAQDVWQQSCAARTGTATCEEWVQSLSFPADKAFWQINSLKVFTN